jgi:hypothetical protein
VVGLSSTQVLPQQFPLQPQALHLLLHVRRRTQRTPGQKGITNVKRWKAWPLTAPINAV